MWFTETPWPPIVACSVVAALFLGLWFSNQRGLNFAIFVGALLACVGIYVVEGMIVTDSEVVEQAVYDLADAVEREDLEGALAHLSPNATAERALVTGGLQMVEIDGNLRISDLQVEMMGENSRARSHFRANGTIRYQGQMHYTPTRWMLNWQREGGEWRVTGIERLSPTGGDRIDPMAKRVE